MKLTINMRVTSKSKCKEGFLLIINGSRIRFKTRALAVHEALAWMKIQRVRVLTVREYAEANRRRLQFEMGAVAGQPKGTLEQ